MSLALACSLAWVAADLTRKALVRHHPDPVTIAALAPFGAAFGCSLYVLSQGLPLEAPPAGSWHLFLALCAINLTGNFLFIHALSVGELSAVLPVFCLTPVVGAAGGWLMVGEGLGAAGAVGIVMVIGGTFFILKGKSSGRAGVASMLGAVLCWGFAPALDKAILAAGWSLWTYMLMALWGVAVPLLIERLLRARHKLFGVMRESPWLVAALIPAGAAALGLQLMAVVQIEVGLLEAIKRGGVVLSVALAAPLFGERSAWRRLPFMVVVACGVFMLAQTDASASRILTIAAVTAALSGLTAIVVRRRTQLERA